MIEPVILGDCTLYLGDCLEVMKQLPDKSVDAVITDPPYGINKAEWDNEFPIDWYSYTRRIAETIIIITGGAQLKYTIPLVGDDFIDVIISRNLNGMTFSPLGFGNYLAAVISGKRPRSGVTFFELSIRGKMPDHPSPKPIEYILKLIERTTNPGDIILDPFMGSGTTGVACVQLGRKFIGCEIHEPYFDIAVKRIKEAQLQMRLEI
jgi:DNA modification methylase